MTTINTPAAPPRKSQTWIILALVGLFGCICIVVLGVVLWLGVKNGNVILPGVDTSGLVDVPPTLIPTSLASNTPLAPATDTPVPTVAPTFTAVPTQSISTIVEALKAAAEGRAVPEAASYDPKKSGVHPIVVYSASQEIVDEYNASLPDAWRAQNVSLAELVAVITNREVKLEKGHYFGSGVSLYIWRIRMDTEVILREAKTGITVASTVFQGGDPPTLKSHFPIGTTALYGTLVPYEIVELWLKAFVEK